MEKITIKQAKELDHKTFESFRVLRTNLEHVKKDGNVIVFTSVMGKEGKSFVAFQTACAMAAAGKSCVYVNGNLRKVNSSDIYEVSNVKNTLMDCLNGKVDAGSIVYETNIGNLYLVESGAVGPCSHASELLSGPAYQNVINTLREKYSCVIIDTPAVGEVADGLVAAQVADGVVLVMEPEVVPYEKAQKVKSQLELNGCHILGVVLNK